MPPFNPFNRKRKPDKPAKLTVWNAEMFSEVVPLNLAGGEYATHSIVVDNFDLEDYELHVRAQCGGPRLRYGKIDRWKVGPVVCRPSARTSPAASTKVHFPKPSHDDDVATPEQIRVELTMTLVDAAGRRFAPESSRTVHTIQLLRT